MNGLPTLNANGWTTNDASIFLKLFEYFLTSQYSQSVTYIGNIASLKYIVQMSNSQYDIQNAINTTLSDMYKRFYSLVNIDVEIDDTVIGEIGYIINIDVINEQGKSYGLSNIIRTVDNNIVNMDELLNNLYGE